MAETWFQIAGKNLSFKSRPISFYVETTDGSDYTLVLENGESGTFASGKTSVIMYSGVQSYPKFHIVEASKVKRFEVDDSLYVDTPVLAWSNIERLVININARGNLSAVGNWTNITYISVNGNSLTGDVSGYSALVNATYFYVNGSSLTGDVSGYSALVNATFFRVVGNSLTGNVSGYSALVNANNFYVNGNSLTGDVSGFSALVNATYFRVIGNSLTGDISGFSALVNATIFYVRGNSLTGDISGYSALVNATYFYVIGNFTINYTGRVFPNNMQFFLFRPTTATNPLSSSELDQLLIDLNAITWTGIKQLYADGNNAVRTSASDAAVAGLQSKGVTLYLNV